MPETSFEEAVEKIVSKGSPYHPEAYSFVRESLEHTQRTCGKDEHGRVRHVSGQQLLQGIREMGLKEFGPMAATVFDEWRIHSCRDFGEIVFQLIEAGFLAKTEKDSLSDFEEGYDFEEAFRKPFLPAGKRNGIKPREPKPTQV